MIGEIFFLVIEAKLNKPSNNNLAQLFLELLQYVRPQARALEACVRILSILQPLPKSTNKLTLRDCVSMEF
jgi:hypothetical protein